MFPLNSLEKKRKMKRKCSPSSQRKIFLFSKGKLNMSNATVPPFLGR